MTATKISWATDTVNILGGCSDASEGCRRCYSRAMSHRLNAQDHPLYIGTTVNNGDGVEWTGRINTDLEPLRRYRTKAGRRIFVASMSDWCHPNVPTDFIGELWTELARQPQHTFLLLTKRPGRIPKALGPNGVGWYAVEGPVPCPEPNIHLGTSVELAEFKWRVDRLREAPAARRFLSCEPLLGPLGALDLEGIDQVIVGCETVGSRPGRPMDLGWVREIRDQCIDQGVAFFFKQAIVDGRKVELPELDGRVWDQMPETVGA